MGFFDKVKDLALKAKCGVGIHGGSYSQAVNGHACLFEKTCPDCGGHITKHEHAYDEAQYKNHHTCTKVKYCRHCNHEHSYLEHERFESMGVDDFCKVKEKCIRCGSTQVKKEEHVWAELRRTDTQKTMQCVRCNKTETRQLTSY